MKKWSVLLCALLLTAAAPAVRADAIVGPSLDQPTYVAHSAAPWLLIAALVLFTLLLLWKFRKKK